MKISLNKTAAVLVLIFVLALAMRAYQLTFFEFKTDQNTAISLGLEARAAHFLIAHGMRASLGVDNPPLFPIVMGVLTAVTVDPARLTFFFFIINLLALALAIVLFYCTLPRPYAILAAAFLGLFPAFTIYSNNIWAQCLLPILIILFYISLYRLIKFELWQNFIYMSLLAIVAAQIHASGFFLFILILMVAIVYWKKIDRRLIFVSLVAIVISFLPYVMYLLGNKALGKSLVPDISTQIFTLHLRMASFDFFRNYFRHDLNQILKFITGGWRFVLCPLAFIPQLFFIGGLVEYFRWLFKGKIFDQSEGSLQEYPILFQISGIFILIVTLGYLILRVPTPMHYFIVLFPAYSILTAFGALRIGRFVWGRCLIVLSILATLILLVGVLCFLDRAGGHSSEYGVSYKSLIAWQQEIQEKKIPGQCFDLKVHFIGSGKADVPAALAVLNKNNTCSVGDKIIPAQMDISWNDKLMRYEHKLSYL